MAQIASGWKPRRLSKLERSENVSAYLFLLPWIIGVVVFLLLPLVMSLYAAFTRWTIIDPPPRWIGLDNFVYMFTKDKNFLFSMGITFKYIFMSLPLSIILGVALALLLNQKLPGMNFFRTVFYIPAVVTGVGVSLLWLSLLDPNLGAVNSILRQLGVTDPPNWISSPTWAVPSNHRLKCALFHFNQNDPLVHPDHNLVSSLLHLRLAAKVVDGTELVDGNDEGWVGGIRFAAW